MGYSFDNERKYDLVAEGTYEVILSAEIKVNDKTFKDWINCTFKIRDDVEQGFANSNVFDKIWRDKKNPDQFDRNKLQALLLTQDNKDKDSKYSFEDDDELVQHLNGLRMTIVVLKKPADDYHEEEYNEVKYCSYKPSKFPIQKIGKTIPEANAEEVSDEDLPF